MKDASVSLVMVNLYAQRNLYNQNTIISQHTALRLTETLGSAESGASFNETTMNRFTFSRSIKQKTKIHRIHAFLLMEELLVAPLAHAAEVKAGLTEYGSQDKFNFFNWSLS